MSPTAVNDVITASVKDNTNTNVTSGVSYSWKIDSTEVGTGATYTVKDTDAGKTITLTVTVGEATATATATVKAAETPAEENTVKVNVNVDGDVPSAVTKITVLYTKEDGTVAQNGETGAELKVKKSTTGGVKVLVDNSADWSSSYKLTFTTQESGEEASAVDNIAYAATTTKKSFNTGTKDLTITLKFLPVENVSVTFKNFTEANLDGVTYGVNGTGNTLTAAKAAATNGMDNVIAVQTGDKIIITGADNESDNDVKRGSYYIDKTYNFFVAAENVGAGNQAKVTLTVPENVREMEIDAEKIQAIFGVKSGAADVTILGVDNGTTAANATVKPVFTKDGFDYYEETNANIFVQTAEANAVILVENAETLPISASTADTTDTKGATGKYVTATSGKTYVVLPAAKLTQGSDITAKSGSTTITSGHYVVVGTPITLKAKLTSGTTIVKTTANKSAYKAADVLSETSFNMPATDVKDLGVAVKVTYDSSQIKDVYSSDTSSGAKKGGTNANAVASGDYVLKGSYLGCATNTAKQGAIALLSTNDLKNYATSYGGNGGSIAAGDKMVAVSDMTLVPAVKIVGIGSNEITAVRYGGGHDTTSVANNDFVAVGTTLTVVGTANATKTIQLQLDGAGDYDVMTAPTGNANAVPTYEYEIASDATTLIATFKQA